MIKLSHLFRFTGLSLRRTVFSLSVILFSFTATAQEHSHGEEYTHAENHADELSREEAGEHHAEKHEDESHDEDGHDEDHHGEHGESAAVVLSEAQRQMAGIRLDTLNLQTLSASAYAPGEIKANGYQSYIVSPRVSSVVTTRYAALGEHVKAGQPLVGLFSEEMVTAQSALQQAATEWFRVKQLGQQAVGEKRFVSARTQFNAASRRLKAFGLRSDTIDAIAGQEDYPLGEYTLSALSDGVVMQDEFNQGQRIEAGQSLMLISDEARLWVEARLPAHNDLPLKVGTEAVVMAGGLRAIATITQEAHTIDPQTRTRVVRMDLNNLRHQFHAGMFADIYFQSPFAENVLAVPESALMRDADGEWQIFIAGEDGTLQAQSVTLGKRFGEFQQISGVEPGVTYVSSGAFFVASEIAKGGFDPHNHQESAVFSNMIDNVVRLRALFLLALIALCGFAATMVPQLNLDAFPDVTNVQVAINTEAPGLAAEEVEQLITYPVEAVMYALPDVEEVRSISKTGLSGITVVFKEGTDIYFARQLVFERLQLAAQMIPEGVGEPVIGPNTSGLGQVYQYLLVAEPGSGYDSKALRSLNDYLLKLLLMPVDGITDVLSFGGEVRQYQVNVYPNRLLSYNLTQQDVINALEKNNNNAGGWYLDRGPEQLVIRGTGWLGSGEDALTAMRQIPLKNEGQALVTVGDVASVEMGAEIRQGAVTMSVKDDNGRIINRGEVVSGVVLKRMGANTNATINAINARLPVIEKALPEGVTFEPYYDQADLIHQAVSTVVQALILAFCFIVVVLALFLLSARATFLVLLSIPVSIAFALSVLSLLGISANLMSLGGIAVAIGMLVDGSVVVVENLYQRLREQPGKSMADSVVMATKEVARPVFFATLIILVVFTPLFSFEGVEAKLFQPMAVAIMLALICAVIVALIFVPVLATYVLSFRPVRVRENRILNSLEFRYKALLEKAMHQRKLLVAGMAGLLVITGFIIPRLGTEFAPELEEGTINLRVTLAPSASLQTALDVAPKLEALLLEFPEVTYAVSKIGRAEIGGDPEPVNNIEIYIGLTPQSTWTTADTRTGLQKHMEEKLEIHPGLLFNFSQPIATRVDELLSGVKAQLAIKLFGPDLAELARYGQQINDVVAQVAGTRDVALEQISGEAQLVIRPDRRALSQYGLNVADVMGLVQQGLGGQEAGQIINGNERYDIMVRFAGPYRDNIPALEELRLLSAQGARVRLKDVASIEIESGPPQIRRDDVQRRVVIQANVEGRDMGSVVADISKQIDSKVMLPAGYTVQIGGQFENQQRAMQRLSVVVPLSLVLIALLLFFAFKRVDQVLLIMLNVPLAAVGGVLSLFFSGHYLSVPSSVGFITLFGVAVLNGVVMVESINQRRQSGTDLNQSILAGAASRLRPVLMTAATSALGLVPMLLSNGIGAEIQKPLASVIVGGLITSTLLTLVVLPVFYPWFIRENKAES